MLNDLKEMITRSEATLFQDLTGVIALMVILVASLHVPVFAWFSI